MLLAINDTCARELETTISNQYKSSLEFFFFYFNLIKGVEKRQGRAFLTCLK